MTTDVRVADAPDPAQERLLVFFCARRTGSSTVMGALRNHTNSCGYGELFNPKPRISAYNYPGLKSFLRKELASDDPADMTDGTQRLRDPLATVRAVQAFTRAKSRHLTAFKLVPVQGLSDDGLPRILRTFQPWVFL